MRDVQAVRANDPPNGRILREVPDLLLVSPRDHPPAGCAIHGSWLF